jgi:hypothetical protein
VITLNVNEYVGIEKPHGIIWGSLWFAPLNSIADGAGVGLAIDYVRPRANHSLSIPVLDELGARVDIFVTGPRARKEPQRIYLDGNALASCSDGEVRFQFPREIKFQCHSGSVFNADSLTSARTSANRRARELIRPSSLKSL